MFSSLTSIHMLTLDETFHRLVLKVTCQLQKIYVSFIY